MRRTPIPLLLAALLFGCSEDNPVNASLPVCSGPVTIAVSAGTTPTFTWTPACRAFMVLVELGASDQWGVMSEGTNAIAPGVVYGVVPAGAQQFTTGAAPALVAGQTYDVTVAYWTGPGGDDGALAGNQSFVP